MDLSKMTTNNWLAGGGAIVALINIFLPWYGVGNEFLSININAFDAGFAAWFGSLCVVAAGVIVLLKVLDVTDVKAGPLEAEQLAMLVAAIGLLLILLRLLTETNFTKLGIYLGLIAAGVTLAGAFLSGKDQGIGIPFVDDGGTGGGGSAGGPSTF